MNFIVTYLCICIFVFSAAAESYTFPPFDPTDLAFGRTDAAEKLKPSTPYLKTEISYYEKSLEELRAIMTFGGNSEQYAAAVALVHAGDENTILRLVYSLKQGNPTAEHLLNEFPSRQVIPFLMEEVAHGSMEDYSENWVNRVHGRVRIAATAIVCRALGFIEEFPEPVRDWLKYVRHGTSITESDNLSEKTKFLVEWWILNEKAFLAEKWDEMIPVPHAGSYTIPKPVVLQDAALDILPEFKPRQPWKFKPLEVSESFEDWSARIVHPEQRDLSWVELTMVNGEWIPHPPKRLDPLAAPTSPSRSIKRPTPASENPQISTQSPVWIACLAVALALIFWWWFKRSKTA